MSNKLKELEMKTDIYFQKMKKHHKELRELERDARKEFVGQWVIINRPKGWGKKYHGYFGRIRDVTLRYIDEHIFHVDVLYKNGQDFIKYEAPYENFYYKPGDLTFINEPGIYDPTNEIWVAVKRFFYDPKSNTHSKAHTWMYTPNPMLGGVSPDFMIKTGKSKKLWKWIKEQHKLNLVEEV